ncbi:hypothetical protein YC2023_122587 [Brassica napus]
MLWLVVSRRRWLFCGSDTMRMVSGARFLRGLRLLPSVVSFLLVIGGSRVALLPLIMLCQWSFNALRWCISGDDQCGGFFAVQFLWRHRGISSFGEAMLKFRV